MSLVLVHIGCDVPDYLYDCLYQILIVSHYKTKVFVVLNDEVIGEFNRTIGGFNLDVFTDDFHFSNIVQPVPTSILRGVLQEDEHYTRYNHTLRTKFSGFQDFRDGFWVSTTSRFFYIHALMKLFCVKDLFHIENDIVMYENFQDILLYLQGAIGSGNLDKICMVQDAPGRVIPSVLFFPTSQCLEALTKFIADCIESSPVFLNDMDILGRYADKYTFPCDPSVVPAPSPLPLIFDGAAIGQYLGGIDPKNIDPAQFPKLSSHSIRYANPTKGFVNETSTFKPSTCRFVMQPTQLDHMRVPIKTLTMLYPNKGTKQLQRFSVANAHIHSKQLYQHSSMFSMQFNDIITGDRVVALADFVILTKDIYDFHKNIQHFAKEVIIVKDFLNVNMTRLNNYFEEHCSKGNTNTIKLHVYTHLLTDFIQHILDNLNPSFQYVLYTHNSDHSFDASHQRLLDSRVIARIYAQNIDYPTYNNKLHFLPIGLANSMWRHGDVATLYTNMRKCYTNAKTKSLYVNINPSTFGYRRTVLDVIRQSQLYPLTESKDYPGYLEDLSHHRFCLCLRGNGLDTHRFWEALYLGVVPVIINNKSTHTRNFVSYLKYTNIPFVEIGCDNLNNMVEQYPESFFSQDMYTRVMRSSGSSPFNLDQLKIGTYVYKE